jgi:hypothetical protein
VMTSRDRAELQVAAVSVLYSAALLATFLATWLKAADGSKYYCRHAPSTVWQYHPDRQS